MQKNRPDDRKIRRNRNKEFFKNIAAKYGVVKNSINFLPRLIYFQAGYKVSNVANNTFSINGKLNLADFAFKKYINNHYIFNRYISKSFDSGRSMNNFSVKSQSTGDYKSNIDQRSFSGLGNKNSHVIGLSPDKILNTNINTNINTNTNINANTKITAITNKSEDKYVNNAYPAIGKSCMNPLETSNYSNMLSHKTAGAIITNSIAASVGTGIVNEGRLNMESKSKDIGSENVFDSGRRNAALDYSAAGALSGINAKTGNIRSRSSDLELARRENISTANQKHETVSHNMKGDTPKEAKTQIPLDINSIVTRVYNELERKIRMERERRGF